MHSSAFFFTALLASTVIKDIECLPIPIPTPNVASKITPYAGNAITRTTNRINLHPASSYRGPLRPMTDKEAVVIVDAKHDDNMAITHLRNSGLYSTVRVVVNGVNNKEAAHGSIHDYQKQLTKTRWEKGYGPYLQSHLKVYRGGENPLEESVPHEKHFPGSPRPIKLSMEDLPKHFDLKTKQAPMKDHDMNKLFHGIKESGKKIGISHTTVGYNNLQGPEKKSNGEAEKHHLENFHLKPHNKDAETYLIQSKTTFGSSLGGTQPLDWTQVRSPPNAMVPITKDETFHLDQFHHADKVIEEHNERHKNSPAKQVKIPEQIPGKTEVEKQANLWAGRLKKDDHGKNMSKLLIDRADQRQDSLKKIQEHDENADHSNSLRRLDAVKDGLEKPCAVETCDANHVAIVLNAHYKEPHKFVPVTVKTGREVAPAKKGDPIHGKTLINETSDHARQLLESSFPPIFDGIKSS